MVAASTILRPVRRTEDEESRTPHSSGQGGVRVRESQRLRVNDSGCSGGHLASITEKIADEVGGFKCKMAATVGLRSDASYSRIA